MYVRSSNESRTIESAIYNTAGLFTPCKRKRCESNRHYQTSPIHTVPFDQDILLNQLMLPCPKADEIRDAYSQSDEVQGLLQFYAPLREYIEKNSGSPVNTLFQLYVFYDALNIERSRGLP